MIEFVSRLPDDLLVPSIVRPADDEKILEETSEDFRLYDGDLNVDELRVKWLPLVDDIDIVNGYLRLYVNLGLAASRIAETLTEMDSRFPVYIRESHDVILTQLDQTVDALAYAMIPGNIAVSTFTTTTTTCPDTETTGTSLTPAITNNDTASPTQAAINNSTADIGEFKEQVKFSIRNSEIISNLFWIVDKMTLNCMHSIDARGCTKALVPFVYSISNLLEKLDISNRLIGFFAYESRYNFFASLVQFRPPHISVTEDQSPWRLTLGPDMFYLDHFIEKPILGLNSEKFSVAELTLPLAELTPTGRSPSPTTLAVTFIRSVKTKFRKSNIGSIGASTGTSMKFLEEFTNLVYHIETLEASSSEVSDVYGIFVDQICRSQEMMRWFGNSIQYLSGFSAYRAITGMVKLCPPATFSMMPIKDRVRYAMTTFNTISPRPSARSIGLDIHVNPSNVLPATLAILTYTESSKIRDGINVTWMEEEEEEEEEGEEDTEISEEMATSNLLHVLDSLAERKSLRGSSDDSSSSSVDQGSRWETNESGNGAGSESFDGVDGPQPVEVEESSAAVRRNEKNQQKRRWIEMALEGLFDPANAYIQNVYHADRNATVPQLTSTSYRRELRAIGRLIALGILAGDPGDNISSLYDMRMAIHNTLTDCLLLQSETVKKGFYDVMQNPIIEKIITREEFFAFIEIMRSENHRDKRFENRIYDQPIGEYDDLLLGHADPSSDDDDDDDDDDDGDDDMDGNRVDVSGNVDEVDSQGESDDESCDFAPVFGDGVEEDNGEDLDEDDDTELSEELVEVEFEDNTDESSGEDY